MAKKKIKAEDLELTPEESICPNCDSILTVPIIDDLSGKSTTIRICLECEIEYEV